MGKQHVLVLRNCVKQRLNMAVSGVKQRQPCNNNLYESPGFIQSFNNAIMTLNQDYINSEMNHDSY